MTTKHIDFYFDYISHNAYLMWHQLPALAEKYQCSVRPIPVLFAGFLKAYGQLGPAEIEPKSAWMNRNVWRKALQLGIPFNTPARHPFNPLLLLRMTAADMPASQRESLTGHLFRSIWADQIDPTDREQMTDYLEKRGFPARNLMASANDSRVKDRVKTNTEQCLARGGFGVPTALADGELFWGFDDLPYLEKHLAGDDPLQAVDLDTITEEWKLCVQRGNHRQVR